MRTPIKTLQLDGDLVEQMRQDYIKTHPKFYKSKAHFLRIHLRKNVLDPNRSYTIKFGLWIKKSYGAKVKWFKNFLHIITRSSNEAIRDHLEEKYGKVDIPLSILPAMDRQAVMHGQLRQPTMPDPTGKYYQNKLSKQYIYIHNKIGNDNFEYIDAETLNRLNSISDGEVQEDVLNCRPFGNVDPESYHSHPRKSMRMKSLNALCEDYEFVDPTEPRFQFDPSLVMFNVQRVDTLAMLATRKWAIGELIIANPMAYVTKLNKIGDAKVTTPTIVVVQKQRFLDRFDKIDED